LTVASATFAREAETAFAATTVTYSDTVYGGGALELPYRQVTAVSQVRVNSVVITGWSLRLNVCTGRLVSATGMRGRRIRSTWT
jgi:hypothetical protein